MRTEDDAKFAFCMLEQTQATFSHGAARPAQSDAPDLLSWRTPPLTARTPTADARHHIGQYGRHLPSIMLAAK
jgi:hypothetical protein